MWFFFALIFAVITSTSAIIAKKLMREIDEYHYVWFSVIFSIPFLVAITLIFYKIPSFDLEFFKSLFISDVIGVVAAILAYRAIKISEISLISPISAFNPVFTTILAFIFLRETMNFHNLLGIIAVMIGAYTLKISELKNGILTPFKKLFSNRAVQYSLVAYFIWAVTPLFEKTAIAHTTPNVPPFAAMTSFIISSFLYFPVVKKFSKNSFKFKRRLVLWFILIGALNGVGQTSAFIAFNSANLGFATSIFKLSMVFTVILGWLFFKERNIKDRLIGSIIMLVGVYLLVT